MGNTLKTRTFPEHNYRGIHLNGKTIRIALDPNKPIQELSYAEFYDVCVTHSCLGSCAYCYQDSKPEMQHPTNILEKFKAFYGNMNDNQKPFQLAFGGGEPTSHPDFIELLRLSYEMGITPNYTTNGMWVADTNKKKELLDATQKYCGGVAVSTHQHLERFWREATNEYLNRDVFTNLHIIIGDKKTIDDFANIYKEYSGMVKYFVLLPLTAQGRAKNSFVDWDYFKSVIDGSPEDIAFGANFYPYLCKDKKRFKVSLYEPEIMSSYLVLETMKVFKSSFSSEEKIIGDEQFNKSLRKKLACIG